MSRTSAALTASVMSLLWISCGGFDAADETPRFPLWPQLDPPGSPIGVVATPAPEWPVDERLRSAVGDTLPIIGTAVRFPALTIDPAYAATVAAHASSVTAEHVLKWGRVHPTETEWSFEKPDALVAFAIAHDQSVHGSTLVSYDVLPRYVVQSNSRDDLLAIMRGHITSLVGRYGHQIGSWDVVSNVLDDAGELRPSVFAHLIGADEHIAEAFRFAHEANPSAVLIFNEPGIETPGPKADAAYALLSRLLSRGAPIDAIGMQAHFTTADFAFFEVTEERLRESIRRFASLGLAVYLSELDVRLSALDAPRSAQLEYQARIFQRVAFVCKSEPACRGIRTAGLTDRYSWAHSVSAPTSPLLLDEAMQPKPAFYAFRAGLRGEPGEAFNFPTDTACRTLNTAVCAPFEGLGFEHWEPTTTGGGQIGHTTEAHRGARAMHARLVNGQRGTANITRPFARGITTGTLHARAYVYLPEAAAGFEFLKLRNQQNRGIGVGVDADGHVVVTATDTFSSSNALAKQQWHCIQLSVHLGTEGSMELHLDGAISVSASGVNNVPPGGLSSIALGAMATERAPNTSVNVYLDEVAVGSTPLLCDQ